jgi:hypothetical protein
MVVRDDTGLVCVAAGPGQDLAAAAELLAGADGAGEIGT